MPIDPQLQDMLDFIKAAGYPPMHEGTPEAARQGYRAMSVGMVKPEDVVPVGSVEDVTVGERPGRLYRPEQADGVPVLVFFHGGGFVIGDLDTHDQACRRICRDAEVVVLSVDYRLAPEHPFPAGIEDALAAVRWAVAELGVDRVAVGGDSAGGNLSAVCAQELPELVSAQVLIYPAVDPFGEHASRVENATGYFLEQATMEWFFGHYAGGQDLDVADTRLSPQLGSAEGLAPALVVTAELDPLRDEGEAYAAKLAAAGVEVDVVRYDGMIHGFLDMGAFSPAAATAVDDLVARTRKLLRD
ncbi:alpha/beta hydrolase [Nocardioides sp. KIGAM211]|uniref:Alpha/beta hydrolase n=1 Tax=Nocardioides luti TaxID=2761101 RepID=A0A7X0VC23_9ACTN|nr:alpha/beta hydrolase [Nocardioides luti]MBB6628542.1 alpha/beta hydrolase [Nocardioides luti]